MKIAIFGWGSLLWEPKGLKCDKCWRKDGPELPIEFARISTNGRLTLVIYPDAEMIQTYWTLSSESTPSAARENLREREGTKNLGDIGLFLVSDRTSHCNFGEGIVGTIRSWAMDYGLGAVVWTDLKSNFKCKRCVDFSECAAIEYLRSLSGKAKEKAKEYIVCAPEQTMTSLRKKIAQELGWSAN